jgi:cell wall-associated NlpC family hydrolase
MAGLRRRLRWGVSGAGLLALGALLGATGGGMVASASPPALNLPVSSALLSAAKASGDAAVVARAEAAAQAAAGSLPKVPSWVTAGKSAESLLADALLLSDLGIDDSALQSALATTQAALDTDAVTAARAARAAATANTAARYASTMAAQDQANYESLMSQLVSSAIFVYTGGSLTASVSPQAGALSAYAGVYAASVMSPGGVLAERQEVADAARRAASHARAEAKSAVQDSALAASALSNERAEESSLEASLLAYQTGPASAILSADHQAVAAQAAQYLASAGSLQFTPKKPLPALVTTTPVALTWAFEELGRPYVWGATGPGSFDCSGLTQYVWAKAGVAIPRVAADQYSWTVPVPLSDLLPGDLVFYGLNYIHHVGIYIGDGLMINAPYTGTVVQVSSIWWYDLAGFGRVHFAGTPVVPRQPPSASKPVQAAVVSTAKPVPSQAKPPPGWKPKPGSSTPLAVYPAKPSPSSKALPTTTASTAASSSDTTTPTSTTALVPLPQL